MAEDKSYRTDKTYSEDDFIMLSALQHYIFCPRQCALIHVEQIWAESGLTAEGRIMHERVHEEGNESRGSVRIARGLPLRSVRLGLAGVADVVEFHKKDKGVWQPYPVEYKRGKPKPDHSDTIQLCAQALCLEEMLSVPVPAGALFYGRTRRRLDVSFTNAIREETERTAEEAHRLISGAATPPPAYAKRCKNCSLASQCLPTAAGKKSSVRRYVARMIREP